MLLKYRITAKTFFVFMGSLAASSAVNATDPTVNPSSVALLKNTLCETLVLDPTPNHYWEADFPLSALAPRGALDSDSTHTLYAVWAAKIANHVSTQFASGKVSEKIFSDTAVARQILAHVTQHPHAIDFGIPRENGDGKERSFIAKVNPPLDPAEIVSTRGTLVDLIKSVLQKTDPATLDRDGVLLKNTYRTTGGMSIPGSSIIMTRRKFYAISPTKENAALIMEDVYQRLNKLQAPSLLSDSERINHFFTAMYGFYNAMPLKRGSSSVGKAVFSGIFTAIYGKRIPALEDGIDIVAMILPDQELFIERYRSLITDAF